MFHRPMSVAGQTLEGFYEGESVPVNQKLSDMFLQLHISERTGRGVPKITEVYGKETYEFRENSIVVSIPFTRVRLDENTQDEVKMTPVEGEIKPLLEQGRLAMTIPDKTNSKNQKYITIR